MKKCITCNETKPKKEFGLRNKNKSWLTSSCKPCSSKRRLNHYRLKTYGIDTKQYEAIKKSQDYKCKICNSDGSEHRRNGLCLDHCHKTGKIRGFLCHHCNTALGLAKDDINRLKEMIKYLEEV